MINEKRKREIALCLACLFMVLGIIFYYNITFKNEMYLKEKYKDRYFEYYLYLQKPRFDIIHGLWLMWSGLFTACFMYSLNMPDPIELIVNEIKKRWGKIPKI